MRVVPPSLLPWAHRGTWLDVYGRSIFAIEEGVGPTVGILHGFPTCSLDFAATIERLTKNYRVIVHDHLGFGLSDKPVDYSYSLLEQAEVAAAVWQKLGVRRLHVLAHDYGTSVATELCARRERRSLPFQLESLTLTNGSVLLELAHLTVIQKLLRNQTVGPLIARLSSRKAFDLSLRRTLAHAECLSDADLDNLWAAMKYQDGNLRLAQVSQYLDDRVRFRSRWVTALSQLDIPTHVLWGRRDPIAVMAIAERLSTIIPSATLTVLDGLGHYPMVEDPTLFVTAAEQFWSKEERSRS